MRKKLRTFREVQLEHYKKHPKELKSYIRVALEEYQKDGDEKALLCLLDFLKESQKQYKVGKGVAWRSVKRGKI